MPHLPPPPSAPSQKSYTMSPVSPTSSYTSQDYSYFSPHAPFTSPSPSTSSGTTSVPNSPYVNVGSPAAYGYKPSPQGSGTTSTTTTTTSPGGPVITATMTTRSSSSINNVSSAGGGGGYSGYSGYPSYQAPQANNNHDVLQQFALHIPPPPPLSLSLSAQRNPSSSSMESRSSSGSPHMSLSSTPVQHTLSVLLPRNVQPEMVTISANKGDRIRVVADAWGNGNECHYEWQISFPPHDIDMGAVHARFDSDGRLTLEVRRRAAARARYY